MEVVPSCSWWVERVSVMTVAVEGPARESLLAVKAEGGAGKRGAT